MMPLLKIEFMNNVPKFLLVQNEWLTWYNKLKNDGTYTKPPLTQRGHTVKDGSPGCSIEQALEDIQHCGEYGGGVGFKLSDRNRVVFLDIDHIESLNDLPDDFKAFLILQDSYMERSPSGKGLRIPFICTDKDKLPNKVNLTGMDGELFVRSGHVSITGDHLAGEEIKEITAYQLEQWFKPKKAEVIDIPVNFNHPDISLVIEALKLCKLDQSERVKEVYKIVMKQDYNHYDYWFKIMSACHNYASVTNQMNEMTNVVVVWSQTDEISYEDDDDVIKHWMSLSNVESKITYSTLFAFGKHLRFQWPVEKYTAKGEPTGKPVPTDIVNLKALIDYYNLKFFWDIFSRSLYITGEKEIIKKNLGISKTHFGMYGPLEDEKELDSFICEFAQANGYTGVATTSIMNMWKMYIQGRIIKINTLKLWLETPPNELPEDMIEKDTDITKSNLDYLMSCITFKESQNFDLARQYFDTFFFEVVMPIYNLRNEYAQRSFMMTLTGREACRKTTFCTMLFPANLRRHFITTSTETLGGGKSDRDFKAQLVESVILIVDELEVLFNRKNDSILKNLITTDAIDYTEIYSKHTKKFDRNAAIIATTNKTSFPFEVDSNRRMALIGVEWIDTDMMRNINWHHFYRYYVAEGKKAIMNGIYPWKLSDETIKLQYQENERYRSHTDLEIMFREVFDFNIVIDYEAQTPQTHKGLFGIKQIEGILLQRYPGQHIKPSALKNELKRICGKYTETVSKRKKLKWANSYIEDGIIHSGQWIKYVLPPIKSEF